MNISKKARAGERNAQVRLLYKSIFAIANIVLSNLDLNCQCQIFQAAILTIKRRKNANIIIAIRFEVRHLPSNMAPLRMKYIITLLKISKVTNFRL